MSILLIILVASAGGGALILWNAVSRTKLASEQMLKQYAEILRDVREQRARGADTPETSTEPGETQQVNTEA
jgi:heme exporter protein D